MAVTINVNGVNSGGGNNTQNQPSNNPQQPIYERPDFSQYAPSAGSQGVNNPMPTSDRMVNDIRAEISRRGVILIPGTQNFSIMLNTMRQNMQNSVMGQIDNQYNQRIQDIDRRDSALYNEIKARLNASRNYELSGATSQTEIDIINRRYDNLERREGRKAGNFFAGEYAAAEQERDVQKEEAEQRLTEAMQRLTEVLSQGNKDSYLNNLRDRYREQIWRRDNADSEAEVREASREAAKIQERMQRAMSPTNLTMQRWLGTIGTVAATAINTGVQLDRIGINQDYVGFDMASSVLNGNAFAAIRQENALKEQKNSALYGGIGTAGGALIGAAIGSAFGGVGAIPGYAIGGLIGMLMGTGIGTLGGHLANRGMLIEDERTRVAELWKQEEQRMMGFNDLVMLTRGSNKNISDLRGFEATGSGLASLVAGGGDWKNNPRVKQAMNFFTERGLEEHQAAGLVGNFIRESKLNPNQETHDEGGGTYGIAQWRGKRKEELLRRYGNHPSFEDQLNFVWSELNSTHKTGLEKLKSSKTAQEAARNAFGYYEFSAGVSGAVSDMEKHGQSGLDALRSGIEHAVNVVTDAITPVTSSVEEAAKEAAYRDQTMRSWGGVRDKMVQGIGETNIWSRSTDTLDLYDLGYTAPEFAQQAARRIKQRGFVGSDAFENALEADALERVFSMNSGTLGQLSAYDRFGRNNANQDFVNLAYTLDSLRTTGMREGYWARSDEFAGYMTQLQGQQRGTFLTVDNARVGRQIATGQAVFGDKFGAEVMQGIQQVNNTIQNPKGGFAQTLLYDVIQELYPETRGRIDKIEQAQYDPAKQNRIQQEYQRRIQSIYGGVDTTAGYLAAQEIWGIQNPNVMMPIVKQLSRKGGLESVKLNTSHSAKSEAEILNNGYTPETTQRLNEAADQQMKSLLGYQETITEIVQNILDKIETVLGEKLQDAIDNLKQ